MKYYIEQMSYTKEQANNPGESYIGETKQIAEERWKQHEDPAHASAPSKYLQENPNNHFSWEVLSTSFSNLLKRQIHEVLFICKQKPTFNNRQVDHKKLFLFRNGVT